MASKTYYDILGISPDATEEAIRSAFRSAAKRHHPDLSPSYVQKVRATIRMQELNEAYAVLRNPERRRTYDATLLGRREDTRHSSSGVGTVVRRRASSSQEVTVAISTATGGPRSVRADPVTVWMTCMWVLVGVAYGYSLWSAGQSRSWGALLLSVALGLGVAPLLLLALGAVLAIPTVILRTAFAEAFQQRRRATPNSNLAFLRDMVFRLLGLTAVVGVGAAAWHFGFTPDLLFVALLTIGGGLLGEVAAMIAYLSRRSVLHSTEALLQMDPVPSGAHSNGA